MLSCMAFVNRVLILHRKRACPRGEICTAFFLNKRTWINKLRLFERKFTRYYRNRNWLLLCFFLARSTAAAVSCFASQTHTLVPALFKFIVCHKLQITFYFYILKFLSEATRILVSFKNQSATWAKHFFKYRLIRECSNKREVSKESTPRD